MITDGKRQNESDVQTEGVSSRSSVEITAAQEVNIGGDVVGRDKITSIVTNIFSGRAEARDRRNQLILMRKVTAFWIHGVLAKSVHSEALIELGKQIRPEAVPSVSISGETTPAYNSV